MLAEEEEAKGKKIWGRLWGEEEEDEEREERINNLRALLLHRRWKNPPPAKPMSYADNGRSIRASSLTATRRLYQPSHT